MINSNFIVGSIMELCYFVNNSSLTFVNVNDPSETYEFNADDFNIYEKLKFIPDINCVVGFGVKKCSMDIQNMQQSQDCLQEHLILFINLETMNVVFKIKENLVKKPRLKGNTLFLKKKNSLTRVFLSSGLITEEIKTGNKESEDYSKVLDSLSFFKPSHIDIIELLYDNKEMKQIYQGEKLFLGLFCDKLICFENDFKRVKSIFEFKLNEYKKFLISHDKFILMISDKFTCPVLDISMNFTKITTITIPKENNKKIKFLCTENGKIVCIYSEIFFVLMKLESKLKIKKNAKDILIDSKLEYIVYKDISDGIKVFYVRLLYDLEIFKKSQDLTLGGFVENEQKILMHSFDGQKNYVVMLKR